MVIFRKFLILSILILMVAGCTKKEAEKHYNLALESAARGLYHKALKNFDQAIKLNSKHARAYLGRGNLYALRNEYENAFQDYNKALSIDPAMAETYTNRGNLHQVKGDLDQALADYNKAAQLDPKYANAYYNRAILYFRQGEYEKSNQDVASLQELGLAPDPQFAQALAKAMGQKASP